MEKWVHAIKTIAHINSAQIYIKYAKRHKTNKEANNPAQAGAGEKEVPGGQGAKGPGLAAIGAVAYKNELAKYTQTKAHTHSHTLTNTLAHTRAENVQGKS